MWWKILLSCLLSILPLVELRGGIPLAILTGLNPWMAFLICVFVNILIIPLAFFFLDKIHVLFLKKKFYKKTVNGFFERAKKRSQKVQKRIDDYGMVALMLFVAVPLPGTGAWTGALLAWLLKLNRKKAFLAITLGVIIAGLIVTLAFTGLIALFKIFI
ncbi:MAG: small multi-drug export protein [Candidatus Pacearchaeota archaeon]|nr:small multi-drug export protein [Candidatus Pacearchaeota archaeon]